ncbi:ferrous iron transport protein A [Crassaminicella thermophila]|uniref:Ferrous iron transport protein A n=1 Tax=Crassaminicella thermophila TaxID=2599308 RepID=A0A5C0SK54_CRATE|nr:ferrous iron transport protein A [Crassaminicella thermophila]QEK13329.1 ferrous iron transport protein A [Crassaminicella thermophila]
MERTLKDLRLKENGKIIKINGSGPVKRRLMDMGVVRGTEVYVEKKAPLGDPIEVKIKGYSLTLRKEDAEKIIIE